MGKIILYGISKVPFEIPHEISYLMCISIQKWKFNSSLIGELTSTFEMVACSEKDISMA